ncbi:CHAT domain-containing tetratricopeptide repeat protein [Ancylothrix sp. C2]|uniref:CHAT domain-containing protein n=1 Tax=Ancylothrix sp. D3o TaxID=2953691 RepID=UPI0021BAEED6|nr:CHAT domain-containing tetratricopeptide repeat protein [Ancylothrix sp. D3o]MCT7952929.1 CHAT domain-containing tetratricopeptide repeat protein [Ancylothrix sp. D3o]
MPSKITSKQITILTLLSAGYILMAGRKTHAQTPINPPNYQKTNISIQNLPPQQAEQLLQQGLKHYQQSQFQAAIQSWQKALELYQNLNNHDGKGVILGNLGIAYKALGNYLLAIDYLKQALEIHRNLQNPQKQIILLNNLGNTYSALGEYEQAIQNYQQSLKIAETTNDTLSQGIALGHLGIISANLGDNQQAISYYEKSLQIAQNNNDKEGEAHTFNNLGSAYHALGNQTQALTYYQKSLEIAQLINNRPIQAAALSNLGIFYDQLGEYQKAIQYHENSLQITRLINSPQQQAQALNNLAHAFFKTGKLDEAEKQLRLAIQLLDSLRTNLNDSYHISIFDTQALTYNLLQQVLIAQNRPDSALEISEHGRSRAFVSLLSKQLSSVQNSNLPTPPNITEIQQIARTHNATLIEYSIIPEDGFLRQGKLRGEAGELFIWVVQPTGQIHFRRQNLKSFNLSIKELIPSSRISLGVRSRGETETLAFAAGDLVKLKDDAPDWEPWQVVKIDQTSKQIHLTQSSFPEGVTISRPITDVATKVESRNSTNFHFQKLHEILIEPISDLLPKNPQERVIFIPHEELFLVPFAALQNQQGKYLIENHTILTVPAIQILDLTLKQKQQLPPPNSNPQALIIGNPKMPLATPGQLALQKNEPVQPLAALPNAEIEAKEIAKIFKTNALTGPIPTKKLVIEKMQQSQIIHLATHGLLDDTQGLESAIALAPDFNDNGYLTASEILNLKLKAELVVLSACNTGRGKITGDGVIGLSRALISAGSPSVIVSLWAVPDSPTAFLMTEFYRNLQQTGDKALSLRNAMLKTSEKHPNPRDWAAFILIGQP